MANIDKLVPFIKRWEGGFVNDPDDLGGATNMGITLKTYEQYCKKKGYPKPTILRLRNLSEEQWKDILKIFYWDKFKGDEIASQSVANICVDWLWCSGIVAIKRVQALVGVEADGIAGNKTIRAINSRSGLPLFGEIKQIRKKYIEEICARRPKNKRFRKGWLNRLDAMLYED